MEYMPSITTRSEEQLPEVSDNRVVFQSEEAPNKKNKKKRERVGKEELIVKEKKEQLTFTKVETIKQSLDYNKYDYSKVYFKIKASEEGDLLLFFMRKVKLKYWRINENCAKSIDAE